MILAGMVLPGIKAFFFGHPPAFVMGFKSIDDATRYMSEMYFPTYCHSSPYFIGILVGYYVKTGVLTMTITRTKRVLGTVFYLCMVCLFYAPAYYNYFQFPVEPVSATIYSVFHRTVWTLGFLSAIMFTKEISAKSECNYYNKSSD